MLVLTRKIGERICIGDNVFVSVVRIQGNRVQLAVEAPESVRIHRSEVLERLAAVCGAKSEEFGAGEASSQG